MNDVGTRWVIGLDIDGTLFDGAHVAAAATSALQRANAAGHVLCIVTGRRWQDVPTILGDSLALFTWAVCEDGSVLVDVAAGRVVALADPIGDDVVAALLEMGVTHVAVGLATIGAEREDLERVSAVRDRLEPRFTISVNKGSVALVPKEWDKGRGLRAAIAAGHLEGLRVLAIGDATNDLPMFAIADVAVAVANADDSVKNAGIRLAQASCGDGVAEVIDEVVLSAAALHPSGGHVGLRPGRR